MHGKWYAWEVVCTSSGMHARGYACTVVALPRIPGYEPSADQLYAKSDNHSHLWAESCWCTLTFTKHLHPSTSPITPPTNLTIALIFTLILTITLTFILTFTVTLTLTSCLDAVHSASPRLPTSTPTCATTATLPQVD